MSKPEGYGLCPVEVEEKFRINGHKYHVYVKDIDEIKILEEYLDYDFIKRQSEKMPFGNDYRIQDTEFIVNCDYRQSLVATYPSDRLLGFFKDFNKDRDEALTLDAFLYPEQHPEQFI